MTTCTSWPNVAAAFVATHTRAITTSSDNTQLPNNHRAHLDVVVGYLCCEHEGCCYPHLPEEAEHDERIEEPPQQLLHHLHHCHCSPVAVAPPSHHSPISREI